MRPLVAEVVGVWGVGKSSLVSSIKAADSSILVPPALWVLPTVELISGGVRALGMIGDLFRSARRPRWKEARQLARLDALHRGLQSQLRRASRVVLYDEGPTVLLSWLSHAGMGNGNGHPQRWWSKVVSQWAALLDLVVFIDAPNHLLVRRIRQRSQRHHLKHKPDAEIAADMDHHRAAYLSVLSQLRAHGGPVVLSFSSDQQSIPQITAEVLRMFSRAPVGR